MTLENIQRGALTNQLWNRERILIQHGIVALGHNSRLNGDLSRMLSDVGVSDIEHCKKMRGQEQATRKRILRIRQITWYRATAEFV